ncbi:hypothetical protein M3Y98_00118300 [Aphelenchoides besseyi]|nr:hypothetical protein M3Y98_00118300 [Aphelenchoides besseyi]
MNEPSVPVFTTNFYVEYPTPEQCRQLWNEDNSQELTLAKEITPKKNKRPAKLRKSNQTGESLKRSLQNQRRKERMCMPKNSFVLRFEDLKNQDNDVVWCVDNHQLLLKYVRVKNDIESIENSNHRVYVKTERYAGWLCDEYWQIFSLEKRVKCIANSNQILVDYPTNAEIEDTRNELLKRREAEPAVEIPIEIPVDDVNVKEEEEVSRDLSTEVKVKVEMEEMEEMEEGEIRD